ncbi:MAG: hypothetical protein FT671_03280, partial [Pantoea sp. Brub]|nr:hypothetical protein [Pantoea sp. Brub]
MFYIYHSNKFDILKTFIIEIMRSNPLKNPLHSEIIIVENLDTINWLQTEIASILGITANIKFLLIKNFIYDMLNIFSFKDPIKIAYNKYGMVWMVLFCLNFMHKENKFTFLKKYYNHDNQSNLFEFIFEISDLFKKYTIYRSDWLKLWKHDLFVKKNNENQKWQAEIWYNLIHYNEYFRNLHYCYDNLNNVFISILNGFKHKKNFLSQRIFVFGINIFPPLYLHILKTISNYIDVYVFINNPCYKYWEYILYSDVLNKNSYNKKEISTNPLFLSWNMLGYDNMLLLNKLEPNNHIDTFINIHENNLLNCIQHDILNLKNRSSINLNNNILKKNHKRKCITSTDNSISINICCSMQREVEVLQNYILSLLESNKDLNINDIIIMVTDIDAYLPFIKATFSNLH